MTQAACLYPSNAQNVAQSHTQSVLQVLGGALFLALCSKISIPLFFTPVPLSMQTFGVMLLGGLLGKKQGALSAATYLTLLAFGVPIASDMDAGLLTLLGCSGGYLMGFVAQAYLTGWFLEREREYDSSKTLLALASSTLMLLALGTAWLGSFVGWENALLMGFYPFLPGGVLKCLAAAAVLKKYRRSS